MSAIPVEHDVAWRAPGADDIPSPLLTALLRRLDGVLDELLATTPGGWRDADLVRLLDATTSASSRLTAVVARAAAEAGRRGMGEDVGARHTHHWWADRSHLTRAEAGRLTRLGLALDRDVHASTAAALAEGDLRPEQALVVVDSVDALPEQVAPDVRARAERELLAFARQHDAVGLKRIGKRILDVVAPEVGECHEAAVLEAEEARAAAAVDLVLVDDGKGRCHGRFTVPSHVGTTLRRHLLALANPARHAEPDLRDDSGGWKPLRRRLGEALVEYVERYPSDATPQTAGVSATVVVTMTLDQLLADHATALLDDGSRMTAGQARRLACEAGIVPAVLGSGSVPLDLGRTARLFNRRQRVALGLRDGGCTARGCETSASGCHAHHDDPWSRGGLTDLANGRLLCPRHHRLAHDSRYAMTVHADNKVSYAMRT